MHDLSPCDDGTLVAVFNDKRKQRLYQATPVIDHRTQTIHIRGTRRDFNGREIQTNGWELVGEDEAHRVLKQPIFCWSMLVRLSEVLAKSEVVKAIGV
jgi:hypothetical protein